MSENEIIKVVENDKDWAIVGQFNEYDFGKLVEFYSDAKNFMPAIEFARDRARNLVADPTTKDGQIARKALAKRIGQIEKVIADRGMEVARILKAKPKEVDAVRKKVKDTLLQYKEEVLAPIKEIEARQAELVEIDNMPAQAIGCDSVNVQYLIDKLDELERDEKYWKESWSDAQYSVNNSRAQLKDIYAKVKKQEDDAAELERLRRKEAENAEAERKLQEERIRKAQEEAEKAKKAAEEAERKAAEEEAKRKAAEEDAKKAQELAEKAQSATFSTGDKKYKESELLFPDDFKERQRKCNREAMDAIMAETELCEEVAKNIVRLIAKGKIPHVRIEY